MSVWRERRYAALVRREVDPGKLATIDRMTLEAACDSGFLAGNAMFQNLSGFSWEEAATAVAEETGLITRLTTAADLNAEAEVVEEERYDAFEDSDALWDLDVGVIGAVICLSALGCAPIGSCNAGGFGGQHQAQHPYVTFFLPVAALPEILSLAEAAGVGLVLDPEGRAQLYSDRALGLVRFAEFAVARHGGRPS